jgi:fatty-acyl-CoA synthase
MMFEPELSVTGWFAARTRRSPGRKALTFEGRSWTYSELLDRVDRLADGLRTGGVGVGDRVGYIGTNHPALLETFLASSRLGAVFVPLNFRLTSTELTYIINDAGIHTLVTDRDRRSSIDPVRDQLAVRRYLGVELDEPAAGWGDIIDLIEGSPVSTEWSRIAADDLALIMYTSGTTGKPKGVMLTHGNLWWNVTNLMHLFEVRADDVTLATSPLFHIAGLNVTIPTTWRMGGEVVLHRSFDAQRCLDDIERYRVSTLFGAPTMFQMMSALPGFAAADTSSVRMIICGGAPVPESLVRLYHDRGITMLNGYGLTETSPSCCFLTAEHAITKVGSVGQPPLYSELRVVDDDGHEVRQPGALGEVCVRGPNVTPGYWRNPTATAAAFDQEGWFYTEDVGYLDQDGFLYIADRKKDVIVTGGENVASAEVENVLIAHPSVFDVAVIGTPHDRWGETVTAVVVPRGSAPTLEDLRSFAGAALARYKLPTRIIVVDNLPRNPSGKVIKVELRAQFIDR